MIEIMEYNQKLRPKPGLQIPYLSNEIIKKEVQESSHGFQYLRRKRNLTFKIIVTQNGAGRM